MPDAKNCGFLRVVLAASLAVVLGNGPVLSQSLFLGGGNKPLRDQ
jgi:hypothetical protein